jgi:hypothetical protein
MKFESGRLEIIIDRLGFLSDFRDFLRGHRGF